MQSIYLTAIILSIIGGLGASLLRLPPLIGFLAAGFASSMIGLEEVPYIGHFAELGVTTLLFTIGLKLNPRDIASPRVIGTAAGHTVANTVIFAVLFGVASLLPLAAFAGLDSTALIYIGIATSFSSTVFVMSQLEERNRSGSSVGRIAIGVLVLQDIIAVGVMVFSAGTTPELWALLLPLMLLLRPIMSKMPNRMFRPELLVLTGIGIAVAAYSFFEIAGVSGSLGSLVAGIILSGHPVAERLSKALISVRELLLVAFFFQIGLGGLPSAGGFVIAAILVAFLVVKALIFLAILRKVGMSNRTSTLAGLTLANYSEFGLIVTAVAVEKHVLPSSWLSIMAIAVGGSFVVGSVIRWHEDKVLRLVASHVPEVSGERLAADERPVIVRNVDAIVLGMGRVGEGVYHRLQDAYGLRVYGVDFNEERIAELRATNHDIIAGDVTDPELWHRVEIDSSPTLFVLALPGHWDSLAMLEKIRHAHPTSVIATTTQVRHRKRSLLDGGADIAVYLYEGAGEELADQAMAAAKAKNAIDNPIPESGTEGV